MLSRQITSISASRLDAYLLCFYQHNQNKQKEAIAVYTALQHRIGIYFSLIQEIEVALRNEMSELIRKSAPSNDLYKFFHHLANNQNAPLTTESKKQIQKSIKDCKHKKNYDENDIISRISFGFWVNLLDYDKQRNPHVYYWQSVFNNIFDKRFSTFKDLYNSLKQIMRFRNRLYHQEIVWNKKIAKKPEQALHNLKKTYDQFESVLQKIAPERYTFRLLSQALTWQYKLFFEPQLFEAEIAVLPQHIL